MESATSKEEDKLRISQEHVRQATSPLAFRLPNSAGQIRVRKGQHLDVDGILARSLPQTVSESLSFKSETNAGR